MQEEAYVTSAQWVSIHGCWPHELHWEWCLESSRAPTAQIYLVVTSELFEPLLKFKTHSFFSYHAPRAVSHGPDEKNTIVRYLCGLAWDLAQVVTLINETSVPLKLSWYSCWARWYDKATQRGLPGWLLIPGHRECGLRYLASFLFNILRSQTSSWPDFFYSFDALSPIISRCPSCNRRGQNLRRKSDRHPKNPAFYHLTR